MSIPSRVEENIGRNADKAHSLDSILPLPFSGRLPRSNRKPHGSNPCSLLLNLPIPFHPLHLVSSSPLLFARIPPSLPNYFLSQK